MAKKLRVALRLLGTGTFDLSRPGNVQGDEQVALGWQKYLLRREEVEAVFLLGPSDPCPERLSCLIAFNPFLERSEQTKNILYLQNAFRRDHWEGGTAGVFNSVRDRFDGFIFTSNRLMKTCAEGAVIPFATDPEVFYPQYSETYSHPVCFVGNDIRGAQVNHRFLVPAIPFGLVIYGNNTWAEPLRSRGRGRLPADDLPKVYSSVNVNLNCHIEEHILLDTVNLRLYDILACGGLVISDKVDSLEDFFGGAVICTEGYEDLWAKLARYSGDSKGRRSLVDIGRRMVLGEHTYAHRVDALINYLHDFL
ncbi:MAG: glycosyltransferase [Deltaproteobacteria bacterium]|nr:glycosyltransferase [Deltaproteobacteria bacterium]